MSLMTLRAGVVGATAKMAGVINSRTVVGSTFSTWKPSMGLPRRVEVIGDPGLERGAAILDSSRGALDASVETQLAEIERGFADLVRRT